MHNRNIYLIRHGKPAYPQNISYCIGQTDLPLSPLGQMQAVLLAAKLASPALRGIYSSPLSRARETASILAAECALPVQIIPALRERSMGEWDGLPFSLIRSTWPDIYAERGSDPDFPIPGAESLPASLQRFHTALQYIISSSEGDIAIVSHTDVISSFAFAYAKAQNLPVKQRSQLRLPCGGYYQFTVSKNHRICSWDPTCHSPHPEPDEKLCLALRHAVHLPVHIQEHCDAVTSSAMHICDMLSARGFHLDRRRIKYAAMLHDIARLQTDHASVGGQWLTALGYPEIGQLIAVHHDLPALCLDEAAILFIADKITQHTATVTLAQRFSGSLQKCHSPEALLAHQRQLEQAVWLKDRINAICQQEVICAE